VENSDDGLWDKIENRSEKKGFFIFILYKASMLGITMQLDISAMMTP